MPRPPRLHDPEGIYHVVVRGDNREPVFVDEFDRQEYLARLRRCKDRFKFACYAYALMTNHVHLLFTPGPDATVSAIMHVLNLSYTKYFNRRYDRVGHLYQGRFHSVVVERDSHLLEVTRYIHLNPVRAGMVRHPRDYPWTSYQAYVDPRENRSGLVDTDFILAILRRISSFDAFLEADLEPVPGTGLP